MDIDGTGFALVDIDCAGSESSEDIRIDGSSIKGSENEGPGYVAVGGSSSLDDMTTDGPGSFERSMECSDSEEPGICEAFSMSAPRGRTGVRGEGGGESRRLKCWGGSLLAVETSSGPCAMFSFRLFLGRWRGVRGMPSGSMARRCRLRARRARGVSSFSGSDDDESGSGSGSGGGKRGRWRWWWCLETCDWRRDGGDGEWE